MFIWNRAAPKPTKEASTVMKNGCLVLGLVNSVSAVIEFLTAWNIFLIHVSTGILRRRVLRYIAV